MILTQEVETVLPEAVKTMQQYSPNIYCNYDINNNNVTLTDNSKYTPVLNHKLEILRTYNFITSDYEVSDELELHMILIEIPDRHIKAYDNFLTGKYSQMYDPEFVRAIFKRFPKRKMILLKDPKYKSQLEKELGLRDGFIARNAELLDPINYEKEIYKYQEVVT